MGTKEATNNFFVAPQPKGFKSAGSGSQSAAQQQAIPRLIADKVAASSATIADTAQTVAANLSHSVASVGAAAASAAQAITSTHGSAHASHGAVSGGHGHGHGSHAAPWEGVNLWRTPFKGDTDTITRVKRSKGALDQYVENRTRRIQQLQLHALVKIFNEKNFLAYH